jgi:negative regulator of flagellin synthesis FlgM
MMNTNGIGNNLPLSPLREAGAVQKTAIDTSTTLTADKAATASAPLGSSDQASLSHTSTLLAQALTTSDVRMDKVASLQQAIASGSYHVSSSDVADMMLKALME